MNVLAPTPKIQFFTNNGDPLAGGKIYTYERGTTTPLETFTTPEGGTANPNPIVLDAKGQANVWFKAIPYTLSVYDSDDVLQSDGGDIIPFATAEFTILSDMLAAELIDGNVYNTNGYYTAGDGGAGYYTIVTLATYGKTPDELIDHTVNGGTHVAVLSTDSFINVKQAGAKGDSVALDTTSIAASITYAEERAGAAIVGESFGVYFPGGNSFLTGELEISSSNLSLFSDPGKGALILSSTDAAHTMITIGDDAYSSQVYHIRFENLAFLASSTIADRTDTTCLEFHDAISCTISKCLFNNWNKSIDGYRFNGSFILNCEWRQHHRTTLAHSAICLNGRSTDGKTSGGNHLSDSEMWGSGATQDAVYNANIEINSADGLYVDNVHMYKSNHNVLFSPDGSKAKNYLEGIRFSDCYFDATEAAAVQFQGSVADNSGLGGNVGLYQNIQFADCYFRAGATTDSGTVYANFLVVGSVDSTVRGFRNIQFTGCNLRGAGQTAMLFNGAGSSKVSVEGLSIVDSIFAENRQNSAGSYSIFSGEVGSLKFADNTVLADATTPEYLMQVIVGEDAVCDISNNQCGEATYTNANPFRIPTSENANINISDNVLPKIGRTIKQAYYLETTDATPTNLFEYEIPGTSAGYIQATVLGRGPGGLRAMSYTFTGAFREVGAGGVWLSGDPTTDRAASANPSTMTVAMQITGSTLEVQVVGLVGETIEWTVDVEMFAA